MGIFLGGGRERRTPMTFPEPPIPPYPGAPMTGTTPNLTGAIGSALVVPTVWACVSLLANVVSMMRLETFRRTNDIPRRVTDPQVITAPADGMTQSEWLHMLMLSLLLRGNAYGRIVRRDAMLRPIQIELQNPDEVRVTVDRDTGKVTYKMGQKDITDDIWHVRGMTLPGSKVGLSPIDHAAATLGLDISSRQFAFDFFNGGGIPKAVLTHDRAIDQDTARTIKAKLLEAVRGREPLVLGAGFKYDQIQVSPDESQFLATQQANIGRLANFFGVPPDLVGGSTGNSMTYSNLEQRSLHLLVFGASFWMTRIEDSVFPLLPQPQYVKFNPAALLRTDAETQAKVDNMQLAGKVKVPSEIRNERDMPPMTDAQKAEADMVPLTITPLGGVKALPALKEPPGPGAAVPADDQQGDEADAA